MTEVTISDQERQLLDLVARGEAVRGADPYISLWPSTTEPRLIQMTLAEVDAFQGRRKSAGFRSTACGRYQFIRSTLRECVGYLGVDPTRTRFTPDVQDALILARLKVFRQLNEWLEGTLPTERFMIRLAQEFASMPVPYAMQGHKRPVQKGQSYYAGDGLNKSNHDPDTVYQELEDIRTGGTGGVRTIPVNSDGPSGALPPTGTSPRTQVATQAAGNGVGAYVGGNAGARPLPSSILPAASSAVYQYRLTDPLDDRYDFRTGEKIKDLGIHGTGAAAATPVINGNIGPAGVATTNSGVEPPTAVPVFGEGELAGVAENLQSTVETISSAVGSAVEAAGGLIGPAVEALDSATGPLAAIAQQALAAFDESAINLALTGGLSTLAGVFDSAFLRSPRILDNAPQSTPTRTPGPAPVSTPVRPRPTRPGQERDRTLPTSDGIGAR